MAERHSVLQQIKLGRAQTAYNPTTNQAVTRRLMSMSGYPQSQGEYRYHTPQGDALESDVVLLKEWAQLQVEGVPTYNEMGLVLASILENPNGGQSGIAAGSGWLHDFYFRNFSEEEAAAFTMEFGDATRTEGYHHVAFTDFELDLSRNANTLKATALGRALEDAYTATAGTDEVQRITVSGATSGTFKIRISTVNGTYETAAIAYNATSSAIATAINTALGDTPVSGASGGAGLHDITFDGAAAYQGIPHPLMEIVNSTDGTITVAKQTVGGFSEYSRDLIVPSHVNVYAHDTYASIASGKLTRAFVTKFAIKGVRNPFFTQDDGQTDFVGHAKRPTVIELSILAMADGTGMQWLTHLRNNQKTHLRVLATGSALGGGQDRIFQIDMPAKVRSVMPRSDNDGIYAAETTFFAVFDEDLGRSLRIRLVNDVEDYTA